jgi:VWFA-related protein
MFRQPLEEIAGDETQFTHRPRCYPSTLTPNHVLPWRSAVKIAPFSVALACLLTCNLLSQTSATDTASQTATLRVSSRAVVVDVLVTDRSGRPVTGLSRDAFSITEQGKPQTLSFFEEHTGTPKAAPAQIPKLPPNTFSNFSPFPAPPAVNVLLLDSLNTRMSSQSFIHEQARKFLKDAKPGSRMAIFAMGLGFHFIQGFTDDPALLMAALDNKKNNAVEASVMLKSQSESNAEQNVIGMMSESAPSSNGPSVPTTAASPEAIAALQNFFRENDTSRSVDRMYLTLTNLQKLATFLEGFPGRKNIIWFAETVPAVFVQPSDGSVVAQTGNPGLEQEIKKTLAMLAAARVALYPVDARGLENSSLYSAEMNLPKSQTNVAGPGGYLSTSLTSEDLNRNSDQLNMQIVARESGGKAFTNVNGISQIISHIAATSSNFYTLSYTPVNSRMDGLYRSIDVKVSGGKYDLSFRRGYFAVDTDLPGSALDVRNQQVQKLNERNHGAADPLLPFMDLGMPQSQQILLKALIHEQPLKQDAASKPAWTAQKAEKLYTIDFAIDLQDIYLRLDPDGVRHGNLNVSLIAYDRYGNIVSRADHLVGLNVKRDVYAVFQKSGVQLRFEIGVPKGDLWLRAGVYDPAARKVGTMEVPLALVTTQQDAAR